MIAFTCSECGKTFRVPDQYAGRSAKCKICGNTVMVPLAQPPEPELVSIGAAEVAVEVAVAAATTRVAEVAPEPPPPPQRVVAEPPSPVERKVPMRTRRLRADAAAMASAFDGFDPIAVEPLAGDPPEAYRVRYAVAGLDHGPGGNPVPRGDHAVEIQLSSDYPRLSPKVKMLTPVFHPNIDPASVCVGDHWTAGERLVDLVIRIGEMLAYQAYNIQSPLDGEAAMWADLHRDRLPTDRRNLRPPAWE